MTTKEINEKLLELHSNKPSNCKGISYTKKEVNGTLTDEWSFCYMVDNKKPISELSDNDIVPSIININGNEVVTDVIEGQNKLTGYENCPCDFYYWTSSFCSTTTVPQPQRSQVRPLKGGTQISNPIFYDPSEGTYSRGTFGFTAVDSDDGSLVGVTNNHVLMQDAFMASEWSSLGPFRTFIGQKANQALPNSDSYTVGVIKRFAPLLEENSGVNYVDGALFTIKESTMSNTESYKIYGLDSLSYPLPFATTEEIDDLPNHDWDFFSTGVMTGIKGNGTTKLKFDGFSVISLDNDLQGGTDSATFAECISYKAVAPTTTPGNVCYDPIYQGDSGSCLIARINGVDKIIGLCFAGSFTTGPGVNGGNYLRAFKGHANRIDRVVEYLNIEPYTGQTVNFSNDQGTEIVYISGKSNQASVTQDGKTYYQAGLINN